MLILNLGCGTKTSASSDVVNIDWSVYVRLRRYRLLHLAAPVIFRGERLERYRALSDNILAHDLSKGIPFDSGSVDAIYHSHFLEHLDRDSAAGFLREAMRVLKPGGVHRIVVPDFEAQCKAYIAHIDECEGNPSEVQRHDLLIETIIKLFVLRESTGSMQQTWFRRILENSVLGDARKRGQTHQWMYDRVSLPHLLDTLGYQDVSVRDFSTSAIPDWSAYGLDTDEQGGEIRPESLYVEATK